MTAIRADTFVREPEIELRVADYGQQQTILSAEITVPSANCAFSARSGQVFPNNGMLVFVRRHACAQIPDAAEPELFLTMRLNGPGGVAVWTAESVKPGQKDAALLVADRTRSEFAGRALMGAVAYQDDSRSATRFALLTYVWQLSRRALIALIASAVALAGLAAALLSGCDARSGMGGRWLAAQGSLAAFSAALALAIVYACVVPPFQAADETDHFLGLANLLKKPQLAGEATSLEQLGHVDRIVFHTDEHFNLSDVGHPRVSVLFAEEPDWGLRGRGILAVWSAFAPVLHHANNVSTLLLLTRVLNAAVFSIAVGLFVWIVATFSPSTWPALEAFPLFIIPTLPFFGMYVSNYAPLSAVYVLFAAAIVMFVWDGDAAFMSGPLMGFSWAAATLLSRSAFPLAAVLVGCAAARVILGPRVTTWWGALVFWVGLAVPGAIALAMIPQHLLDVAQRTLPSAIRPFWDVIRHSWLLVPLGIVASVVERWLHRVEPHDAGKTRTGVDRVVATLGYAGAVAVAVSIALSAVIDYPTAPVVDLRHVPPARSYVVHMLLAAGTMFRFGQADFLTSQSFWSGYGWLDTPLPSWLVTALAVSTGAALVVTLISVARTRASRTGVTSFFLLAGLLAAVATASFTVLRSTIADLHGRYLLGIYLCLIAICWHWLPRVIPEARPRTKTIALVACGLSIIAIHALAFATILARYFG